jgi:hypothetical protein
VPGFFNFVDEEFDSGPIAGAFVQPKSIADIMKSSELFLKALKRLGIPDEYDDDALIYFEEKNKDVS